MATSHPVPDYYPASSHSNIGLNYDITAQHPSEVRRSQHQPPTYIGVLGGPRLDRLAPNDQQELKKIWELLQGGLTNENYASFMKNLLYFEESQMDIDIRKFDMNDVSMQEVPDKPNVLALEVPSLEEKRPSILPSDLVQVVTSQGIRQNGVVKDVQNTTIHLSFNPAFRAQFSPSMKFKVQFSFNRLPMRLAHAAVQLIPYYRLQCFVFPDREQLGTYSDLVDSNLRLSYFNQQIASNPEQSDAVFQILRGGARPVPYILYGPPGTGKTVTMVEAIAQVYTNLPESHLLVCAPSNSAVDLLTSRILDHVPKEAILRILATARDWNSVPIKVKVVSNYNHQQGKVQFPGMPQLMKYRILICTLFTAGRIAVAEFPRGHFTHVFIDEAGHSTEPDSLIPVVGVLDRAGNTANRCGGNLILAGDPNQLGPYIRNPGASKFGLGMSLLERLITKCPLYSRGSDGKYNRRVLTKLVRNYRSHPYIIAVSNYMFYENELVACGDRNIVTSLTKWDCLPRPGFPLIFHHVIGVESKDESCPSFYNPQECKAVMFYVMKLLQTPELNLVASDIGIIAPYRAQVKKLRMAVNQLLPIALSQSLTVGSTEEFQGQERKVMILSTVRSDPGQMSRDVQTQLGFLSNPKRFNVAITRAQCLLIVIGNPDVLKHDNCWSKLLTYMKTIGGYIAHNPVEVNVLAEMLQPLQLG